MQRALQLPGTWPKVALGLYDQDEFRWLIRKPFISCCVFFFLSPGNYLLVIDQK